MKKIENHEKFMELISEDIQSKVEFCVMDCHGEDQYEVDDSDEAFHNYFVPANLSLGWLASKIIDSYGYMDWLPVEVNFGHDFIEEKDEMIPYTFIHVDYYGE